MLCEQQRTSRQAGSCTETLETWLFNSNMQQGQAERAWEWLDHMPQRKSGIGKGKGAAIVKCSEVLERRGHIGCIFNIFLTFSCEHWAISVESTQKHLKSSSWKQQRLGSRPLILVTAMWTQESCGSLSLRETSCLQWCNKEQPLGFLVLGREAVRGLILSPQRDGNSE